MKVGSDAMILGALAEINANSKVLDVGAGTGVLSLMLAQKAQNLDITCIENDENALLDLNLNISNAPFEARFEVINENFVDFYTKTKFNCIITNPPFYTNAYNNHALDSRSRSRNENHLPFEILIAKTSDFLLDNGLFWMILPAHSIHRIESLLFDHKMYLQQKIAIYGKPDKLTRYVICATKIATLPQTSRSLVVRNLDNQYSDEYVELTKAFHNKDLR